MRKDRLRQYVQIALAAQTISDTIAQNTHFPLVLALDPDVQAVLGEPSDPDAIAVLNRKLETIEGSGSPAALYVMKPDGHTIAASNWNTEGSFVGQYYGFRAYFTQAIAGGKGAYFGIGVTTGRAGYFIARAVGGDRPTGVTVAKIEFDDLEAIWARAAEHIMVTDENDIIFLASRPDWKYRSHRWTKPPSPESRAPSNMRALKSNNCGSKSARPTVVRSGSKVFPPTGVFYARRFTFLSWVGR